MNPLTRHILASETRAGLRALWTTLVSVTAGIGLRAVFVGPPGVTPREYALAVAVVLGTLAITVAVATVVKTRRGP